MEIILRILYPRARLCRTVPKKAFKIPEVSTKRQRKSSSSWSEAEIKQMADLYESGWSLEQVGKEFGISRPRVDQLFKRAGVRTRKFTFTDKYRKTRGRKRKILSKQLLLEVYKIENLPLSRMLEMLGVSTDIFYNSLAFYRIPLLKGGAVKLTRLSEDILRQLYLEENLSSREIARRLGCARITVKKRLWELGIRKKNKERKAATGFEV